MSLKDVRLARSKYLHSVGIMKDIIKIEQNSTWDMVRTNIPAPDDLIGWLNVAYRGRGGMQFARRLVFNNGNSLSIQAGELNWCKPQTNSPNGTYADYVEFEIGYPRFPIHELEHYGDPYGVCGYVPIELLHKIVASSGGICGIEPYTAPLNEHEKTLVSITHPEFTFKNKD